MHISFVCTGNICRSPMAEFIARERYGSEHTFDSSGVSAMTGWGMTDQAERAIEEIGVVGHDHVARPFDRAAAIAEPDVIYVMTAEHLTRVLQDRPDLAGRAYLLDPDGVDIEDPYGGSMEDYRMARDHIVRALQARLD